MKTNWLRKAVSDDVDHFTIYTKTFQLILWLFVGFQVFTCMTFNVQMCASVCKCVQGKRKFQRFFLHLFRWPSLSINIFNNHHLRLSLQCQNNCKPPTQTTIYLLLYTELYYHLSMLVCVCCWKENIFVAFQLNSIVIRR